MLYKFPREMMRRTDAVIIIYVGADHYSHALQFVLYIVGAIDWLI